jgi:hypothetical protein
MTTLADWYINGSASRSGSDVVLTPDLSSQAGSAIYPTVVSAWGMIQVDVTMTLPTVSADGFACTLLDSDFYTTSWVGNNGDRQGIFTDTPNGMSSWEARTYSGFANPSQFNAQEYGGSLYSVSTYYLVPSGTHAYTFTWSRATASTASLTVRVDGVLRAQSPITMWCPDSALIMLSAGTGGLHNAHIANSATVTVTTDTQLVSVSRVRMGTPL